MNILKIRGIFSLLLIVSFFVVFFSGLGLYFAPIGKIARETNWNFFGFDKPSLEKIHTLFGFIMSGLVIIHLFLNYKLLFTELKTLFKTKKTQSNINSSKPNE
jgi:cytochrome b subunit of formate dehydrogenase